MKKYLAASAIGAVILIGAALAFWHFNSTPEPEPVPLDPYDYAVSESWTVKPEAQPAPVWQDGWAMDVVLLLSPSARRDADAYSAALAAFGPVYAPKLRETDLDTDTAKAVQYYLETYNHGRAFVIASDSPLSAQAAAAITSDPLTRARFGGVLQLEGQTSAFAPDVSPSSICSDRFGREEICAAPVEIRRVEGEWTVAGDPPAGGAVIDGFIDWLNASAPKLAEPLGALEEVEIVEIRRPGQTD